VNVAEIRQLRPSAQAYFDENGFVPARLGAQIQREANVELGIDGRLYRYRDGVYLGDGEAFVRARTRERLGDRFKRRHGDEAVAWLRAHLPKIGDRPTDLRLCVANGLLDPLTGDLGPHTPEVVVLNRIPVAWDPRAECPSIDAFLLEVLPADAQGFIEEVIGLALYASNPFRVAVLLLGPGANGKSVLLVVISALVGPSNVANVPLQVITENRFAAAELFGKLANICGDLDARAVKQTDVFKMLTGGDPILAERKHRDHFSFTSYATPIFSANEAPLSSDQSQAWFDRWQIVPMDRRIPEDRRDPHLAQKLTTAAELQGLLVRGVAGLRRLLERGRFDPPASVRAAAERYRDRLDTVRGFVADECVLSPSAWIPRSKFYAAYRTWCTESGRFPLAAVTVYDHLRNAFPDEIAVRLREGVRGFAGVGLRAAGGASC